MKFKVTYDHGFSTHSEFIDADSLKEAKELANLKSVYKYFTIEEVENEQANSPDRTVNCGCNGFYQLFGVHRPGCSKAFDPPGS